MHSSPTPLSNKPSVKLTHDYPTRTFEIHFNDNPAADLLDYQVTFWQPSNRPHR